MDRDEIYDHLAQVYLGKRKGDGKKSKNLSIWILINVMIACVILIGSVYGLTAFFTHKDSLLNNRLVYLLNRGSVTMAYHFDEGEASVKMFVIDIPRIDMTKFSKIEFIIRAKEEGNPGIVKVSVKTRRNEESFYYVRGLSQKWQNFSVDFERFDGITDWSQVSNVTFTLEPWNVRNRKGLILIDNISFSG